MGQFQANKWLKLSSSNLDSMYYEPETRRLWTEFHNGRVYCYFDVPEPEAENLFYSPSAGRFFNAVIKKHTYTEVSASEVPE